MPFYFPPMPVEFYLVLILFSLPLLLFVLPLVRSLAIIIWTTPPDVKRRVLAMALVAVLLAVLVPKVVYAVAGNDPCLVEMPWWYACIIGCWGQCL